MNWETLLSFGDSITFGARSYLSYPEICGSILEEKLQKSWHVINHSVSGYTTIDLVRSINPLMQNYKSANPSIITVMIGTNDIKMNISLNEFKIAYKQLIVKLKLLSINNNIVLLKIPLFKQKVSYPYNFAMNSQIDLFNSCIEKLALENNLACFSFSFEDEDHFDGVHLNAIGCATAALQLGNLILKDKGLESTTTLP